MADTQEIRLAFIDVMIFSDGSIRGGILTTDIETKPYEFRVTSPIKPTQTQQILYGASLKDYVYDSEQKSYKQMINETYTVFQTFMNKIMKILNKNNNYIFIPIPPDDF